MERKKDTYCYRATIDVANRFHKTDDIISCDLSEYKKAGLNIIGLLGREFFENKVLICDFISNKVTIKIKT